ENSPDQRLLQLEPGLGRAAPVLHVPPFDDLPDDGQPVASAVASSPWAASIAGSGMRHAYPYPARSPAHHEPYRLPVVDSTVEDGVRDQLARHEQGVVEPAVSFQDVLHCSARLARCLGTGVDGHNDLVGSVVTHFTCLPSRGEIAVAADTRLVASKTTAATSPNGKYDRDRWPTTPLRRSRSTPENALHGGGHRGGMVGGGRRDAGVGGSAPPDASPRSMGSTADGSADAAGHGAHVHGGRCRRV